MVSEATKENREVRRELSLTTTKGESVLGRTHNTWEWSKAVTKQGLADWEDSRKA